MRGRLATFGLTILVTFVTAAPALAVQSSHSHSVGSQVRKKLVTLPYYGVFDNLAYKIDGSVVTLYGQVVEPSTKDDAEARVKKIAGVTQVINNIEVLPVSPNDDAIRVRVYNALVRSGGLYRYFMGTNPSIHVIVNGGHVALEGVVDNRGDAQLAEIAAKGVPGVFSVDSHLAVGKEQ